MKQNIEIETFICCFITLFDGIMTALDKNSLDLEENPTYTISECIVEPLTDDSVCTKSSLSSIPIEIDVEIIELTKTTQNKEAFRTEKQLSTQGKRKTYQVSVPSGVICLDISVKGKHKNNKICLDIYTPTGECCGKPCSTGTITRRISPKGSKYLRQGKWMFTVSGDEDYTFKAKAHCN